VMMVMLMLRHHGCKLHGEGCLQLGGLQDLLALKLLPRGGDDGGVGVETLDELQSLGGLLLADHAGAAEDHGPCRLDLVAEEFAEVLKIHLALLGVSHCNGGIYGNVVAAGGDGVDDVGQLAYAGGLDDDALGAELVRNLFESLGEIALEGAADAAGVHLVYHNAGVLEEAAVDGDIAEFVLDENYLLVLICFCQQFLDKGGLAGSEETGEDINFYHCYFPFL